MILENSVVSILMVKCKNFPLYSLIYASFSTLENLHVKNSILELINDPEPTVKEQALVAIQKIMLHSWQAANVGAPSS